MLPFLEFCEWQIKPFKEVSSILADGKDFYSNNLYVLFQLLINSFN